MPKGKTKKEEAFPNVAKWVQGYGWIEIGEQEQFGFMARVLDAGGLVFEDDHCSTLDEAMASMELTLAAWFRERGKA